jgi:hypothetical protein
VAALAAAALFVYREAPRRGESESPVHFTRTNFPNLVHTHQGAGYGFSGAAVLDANGDEWPDVFLGSGRGARDQLLLQTKGGWEARAFDDFTGETTAVLAVDVNRDFIPDLVLGREGGIRIFINDGNGGFHDVTPPSMSKGGGGVVMGLTAGDVNSDGWLDIYEARFAGSRTGAETTFDLAAPPALNRMWINEAAFDGQGRPMFRDGTADTATAGCCSTYAALLVDLDQDSDQDLVLAEHGGPLEILRNDDGHFVPADTGLSGVGLWMGLAAGDYDNDGDIDLFASNKGRTIPEALAGRSAAVPGQWRSDYLLARNEGGLKFSDATAGAGLAGWEFARGAAWLDFDNDGRLDLYLVGNANGWLLSKWFPQPGRLFRQKAPGQFVDVAAAAGAGNTHVGTSPIAADLNRDGFVDLLVVNRLGPVQMLINQGDDNHWLGVRLRAREQASTFGARVEVRLKDGSLFSRQQIAGEGFMTDGDEEMYFGLGRSTQVDSIRIYWPSGRYTRMERNVFDRHVGFVEPSEESGGRNVYLRAPLIESITQGNSPLHPKLQCR